MIVTDTNSGCTSSDDIVVSQANPPEVIVNCTPESLPDSFDGTAVATVLEGNGPYIYDWSNGISGFPEIDNLEEGIYCVTVTDANGCSTEQCCTVEVANDPITLTIISNDVSCNGGADGSLDAIVDGGQSPYTYLWSNGATTQTINNLSADLYTVTVTDSNGFTAVSNFEISEPSAIEITIDNSVISCDGGIPISISSVIGGTPPYTFVWSNGSLSLIHI